MLMASAINHAAAVTTTGAANGLALRAIFRCGQDHAPKDEGDHANKYQQQNSKMYPTGLGHPISPLFAHPGHQFDSTMWM